MLVDTDVLIWYMRGNKKAYQIVEGLERFDISVVTYVELLQGVRNKQELAALRNALLEWKARIMHISEEISMKAMFYVERYRLKNDLQFADALIGATAVACGSPLLTANMKHYQMIREIEVKTFRP